MVKSGSKDKFLVIEIIGDFGRVTRCSADFSDKIIKFEKSWSGDKQFLKKILGKIRRPEQYKTLITSDSKSLTTTYSSVLIERENPRELIDDVDLENIVSQAIWKFFDQERKNSAGKFGVSETELLPCDMKVRGIKIDGHRVINSIGFPAQTVEIVLSQTLGRRPFLEELKLSLANRIEPTSVIEHGSARNSILGRVTAKNKFLLAESLRDTTTLFIYNEERIGYLNEFNWGEKSLIKSVGEELWVSSETAREIFVRYLEGETSKDFASRFGKILLREFKVCVNGIAVAIRNAPELEPKKHLPIYFVSSFELPSEVFKRRFDFGGRNSKLLPMKTIELSENLGFRLEGELSATTLIPILEFYLSSYYYYKQLNKVARRRMKWLFPFVNS